MALRGCLRACSNNTIAISIQERDRIRCRWLSRCLSRIAIIKDNILHLRQTLCVRRTMFREIQNSRNIASIHIIQLIVDNRFSIILRNPICTCTISINTADINSLSSTDKASARFKYHIHICTLGCYFISSLSSTVPTVAICC